MDDQALSMVTMLVSLTIFLAITAITIIGMWKVFEKANKPGWGSLIPIYNAYLLLKIAGKPGWWLLLMLIPIVNFILMILALISFNEKFGKGVGFLLGLLFLNPLFMVILGFDDSTYSA